MNCKTDANGLFHLNFKHCSRTTPPSSNPTPVIRSSDWIKLHFFSRLKWGWELPPVPSSSTSPLFPFMKSIAFPPTSPSPILLPSAGVWNLERFFSTSLFLSSISRGSFLPFNPSRHIVFHLNLRLSSRRRPTYSFCNLSDCRRASVELPSVSALLSTTSSSLPHCYSPLYQHLTVFGFSALPHKRFLLSVHLFALFRKSSTSISESERALAIFRVTRDRKVLLSIKPNLPSFSASPLGVFRFSSTHFADQLRRLSSINITNYTPFSIKLKL